MRYESIDAEWQRGDVVLDDSGNLFTYHDKHGWFGLASNQCSARGHHLPEELAPPLDLLVRDHRAVI